MSRIDLLITVIVAIGIFICFFLFVPPVSQINHLKEELLQQQAEHEKLETKIAELEQQIDKIKRHDPEEIERIARDRHGYSLEGEEIYPLPASNSNSATP